MEMPQTEGLCAKHAVKKQAVTLLYKLVLLLTLMMALPWNVFAQTNYYSKSTGNLNTLATWGTNTDGSGTAPANFTSNNQIFNIRNNAAPSIDASWTVSGTNSRVVVGDGINACEFTIGSNFRLTATCDVTYNATLKVTSTNGTPVSGTLTVNDGGTYEHAKNGGSIPAATWGTNSHLLISGITTTALTGLTTTTAFGSFTWNCPGQTITSYLIGNAAITLTFAGDLNVLNTNTGQLVVNAANNVTIRVEGNTTIGDGTNTATLNLRDGNTNNRITTVELAGDLIVNTNGTLTQTNTRANDIASVNFGYTGATSGNTVNWNGSGTYTNTYINYIIQNVPAGKTVNLGMALTVPGSRSLTVNNGARLNCSTYAISGGGTFTLQAGGILGIGHAQGLHTTSANGNIQTTTRTFNATGAGTTFVFNGGVVQNTGSNFPTPVTNLTVDNTNGVNLSSAVAVNGILSLSSGILSLGSNNLTLGTSGSISGSFDNVHMIDCSGSGSLVKQGTTQSDFNMTYPLGTGTAYTPFVLSNLAATIAGTGSLTVHATPGAAAGPPPVRTTDLQRFWDISTASITSTSADVSFTYDESDIGSGGTETDYTTSVHNTLAWLVSGTTGVDAAGNRIYATGTNLLSGTWTGKVPVTTLYSYKSGPWNDAGTWTTDAGGTTLTGSTVPTDGNAVVILPGRHVALTADVTSTGLNISINEGAILSLETAQFTNTLAGLSGQGYLEISASYFPAATTNTFVLTGGGTTLFNNASDFTLPSSQAIYNHLHLDAPGITATLLHDLTLNGDLYVKQGTFRINDDASTAKRTLVITGNVTVDAGAFITVGRGATNTTTNPLSISGGTAPFANYYEQFHRIVIQGDFTNNGSVRFTNLSYPVYNAFPSTTSGATTGAASVYFSGNSNNTLTCNGTTDFYNLILDKGSDQTFRLTVRPTDYSNFRLFGANISGGEGGGQNPILKKALWIRTGTLVLQGSTVIPSLTEGAAGGTPVSDYVIPANGALVLDGTEVIVLVTSDDYREVNAAYGVSGGSGAVNGVNVAANPQALLLYGKLQVNNGYLSTRESGGILYSNTGSGQFELNGGIVDAKQFREYGTTGSGASYTQTGGTMLLRGRFLRTPAQFTSAPDLAASDQATLITTRAANGTSGTYGTLNINNSSNVFSMSGGTLKILDACGTAAPVYALDIRSSSANTNVTGGNIELLPAAGTVLADASPWLIYSVAAPFGNLTVNRGPGCTTDVGFSTYDVTVLGNLSLTSGTLTANDLDLTVGGNFIIASGTTYHSGTNTTTFNGNADQTFTLSGTVNNGSAGLRNLEVNKATGTLSLAGTQTSLTVQGNLTLTAGTLSDGGKTIYVAGNISNSGTHVSNPSTGMIQLNGTSLQTIGGNGSGIFGNLELNNTNPAVAPVLLDANITLNGTLTFSQDKLLHIRSYNLKLNTTANLVNAGSSRYIQTNGSAGDAGLTIFYPSSSAITFPVGAVSTRHAATPYYTPASIGFTGTPTTLGSITVIPVGYEHPNTTTKGRSLTYFWRVRSSGFVLGPATVIHGYTYDQNDVVTGADITEDGYVASCYNPSAFTWTRGNAADVDETGNVIGEPGAGSFLQDVAFIDGDFTAGDDTPTSPFGTPTVFYSRQSGLWSNANSWSFSGHTGAANTGGAVPAANDIVIIGGNDSIYLATHNTTINLDIRSCASLQIEQGSALDIGYNPGSTFSMVQSHPGGNGNFRLTTRYSTGSTFAFPSGDFSEFNTNLGTTELYTVNPNPGTTYWLPNGITTYGNLIISPLGGSNVIFPNNNVTVYGDLIMRGQNADSWFLPTWNGNYPTAPTVRISKTITVNGDFDIQGGSFGWYGGGGGGAQDVVVYGNVIVAPLAGIDVWGSNTSQSFSIGGSLINNSTNTIAGGTTTRSYVNFTQAPVVFFGNDNALITNTAGTPRTDFGKVTINKGNSQATTLTCDIGGTLNLQADNWLTLQNGTFIYARTGNLPISTSSTFTIPGTAGLYINTPSNVYIARNNVNTNDMYLNGKLTIVSGNVYVGREAGTDANNNDIEYSGGGLSEIDIQGGSLMVNGQIRRNPAMSNGILRYSQSGSSTVTINGQNSVSSNAKLEILNSGSYFSMRDNAVLTILRGGGGTTYGDLFLRPESSSVTGGTIVFQNTISGSNQTYLLDASVTLNNLTLTGRTAATAAYAQVDLMVNPLELDGNLILSNAYSILNTNSIDVTVNGDFTNNGNTASYIYGTNNTTFSGNTQAINGSAVTNFYDLTVTPVTSLTLGQSTTVYNDLSLLYGTLVCGNFAVNVKNNIENNATYTDTQYGVILNGTASQQTISGTGTFGRLELSNAYGAALANDITLQSDLHLTTGILDISQYLLTLGQNSDIGGAPFSNQKMITSDGVYSNIGVKKFFNTGAATFTYPIGISGKYTPADLVITSNGSVGYIRINGVNNYHPSASNPADVLKYYWDVESSGITGFAGTLVLNYLQGDVQGSRENEYVAARLIVPPGTSWSKATPGAGTDNVDESANEITFTYPAGSSALGGEYTAGVTTAIPDNVPIYRSNADGDWTDKDIWTPVAPTVDPCPDGGPNGYVIIIDHTVTANADNCFAYRTTLNGELYVDGNYSGHNLGTVSGNGVLHLENGNLPAGRFSSFFDCSGTGTLEYSGTGNYTMIADRIDVVPNLFFTGTGTRYLPNKDLTVCHELRINGPALDNSIGNRKLTIQGSMNRIAGSFNSGTGSNALVSFAGSVAQTLTGFTGSNGFNYLEINNSMGLTLSGSIDVKGNLLLTNGPIHTTDAHMLNLINTSVSCVVPVAGSTASFVEGPMTKRILTGESFRFPIGKGTTLGNKLTLSSTQGGSGYVNWKAEYFTPNPYSTFNSPLTDVNNKEYWAVSASAGNAAIVTLAWDPQSNLTPLMTQYGLSDMRVADYDGADWNEITSTATGDNYNGSVSTASRISLPASGSGYYSVACINVIKPKATLSPAGPVCGTAGIPVTFTTPLPALNYTLSYTRNGVVQTPVTITSLPYILPTTATGAVYRLTGFSYNGGASTGVVDPSMVTSYTVPTSANAGTDIATCGVTSTPLSANTPVIGTGLWTISNGSGGTLTSPTSPVSSFSGVYGSSYTLRWTITNGSCTSADDMNVNFNIAPTQPAAFTASVNPACQGQEDAIYTVPADVNATSFNWSYGGTGATITGSGNSVSIDFGTSATAGTLSVSTTNGCGTSSALTLAVSINPLPTQPGAFTVSSDAVCAGSSTVAFMVPNDPTVSYNWSYSGSGATFTGSTNSVSIDFSEAATSGTVSVAAVNGCGTSSSRDQAVTVHALPVPVIAGNQSTCTGAIDTYTTAGAMSGYVWSVTGGTISAGGTLTDPTATVTWDDLGNQTVSVNYTDGNGCSASSATEWPVAVFRRPETGPAYIIPNTFNP